MNYFTADFHLGDKRQTILGRPFKNEYDCLDTILSNFNEIIKPEDILYVLGDVATEECWLQSIDEIDCEKILIKGNHEILDKKIYEKHFIEVYDYLDLEILSIPCRLHHYPTKDSIPERFSICGHIHGAWKVQKNMLNVGVDVHHFKPLNEKQIEFYLNAITNFYDEDVWCSQHISNLENNNRGKKGTYYKK